MNTLKTIPALPLLALMSLLASFTAPAATYYVATNGADSNSGAQPQPFQTIQRGINAAQNGDLVLVADGTYSGGGNVNVNFGGKNLTLRSLGGAAACAFGGGGGAVPACTFQNGETREAILDGFTIRGDVFSSGGISIFNGSNPTITRCRIANIVLGAHTAGGGIYIRESSPLIDGCTFAGNRAQRGGGMHITNGSPTIANCTFLGNSAVPAPDIEMDFNPSSGGAIDTAGGSPIIANCTFSTNKAQNSFYACSYGGAMAVGGTAVITGCAFNGNVAGCSGGGVYETAAGVMLARCTFSGNKASFNDSSKGGGLAVASGVSATIVNCLFIGNFSTGNGGAIQGDFGSRLTVLQSTISRNSALRGCGIQSDGLSDLYMTNCIDFGNVRADDITSWTLGFDVLAIAFSDVEGGFSGPGNLNADPLFVNPASADCHLQPGSPCIDAGIIAAPGLSATDLDGAPRSLGRAPDMGAYETTAGAWFVDGVLGSDANAGTPSFPFQTVTKAITIAGNGNSIYIKQANYGIDRPRITKTLRLFNWGAVGLARIGQP
jgi:hypothetical protein